MDSTNNQNSETAQNNTNTQDQPNNGGNGESGSQFLQIGVKNTNFTGFNFLQTKLPIHKINLYNKNKKNNNIFKDKFKTISAEHAVSLCNCLLADNMLYFCNDEYVTNIRSDNNMTITTNDGDLMVNLIADYPGYPKHV